MLQQKHNIQQDHDTTSLLWDYYFKVRIPWLQSRSIEDIKNTGVVLSGVPEIDRDINNQWQTTMLTISQMADYFKEGVAIRVVSSSDVKTIYNHISSHIHAWKSRLERGINIGDSPVDDLILLDRFANTIYDHAKYQFTPEIADSLIGKHLSELNRINPHNFFTGKAISNLNNGITRINATDDTEIPDRDSLGNFFKDRLINLRRY